MHPLGWMVKYFIGSLVGGITVVRAVQIMANSKLGNTVEGIIFRLGIRPNRHDGGDA